ncbi:unnamed protein product, partial [Phaeothamnion confervicola]
RRNGDTGIVLIHIEVQNQRQNFFTERVFVYFYRIYDRHRKPVCTLVILGDDVPDWRPDRHEMKAWGTHLALKYKAVKLLDFLPRLADLETHRNPFGILTAAHLHALQNGATSHLRGQSKFRLLRNLALHSRLRIDQIRVFMAVVDGVLKLSGSAAQRFLLEYNKFEEDTGMNYIPSFAREAWEKSVKAGLEEGLRQGLEEGRERGLEEGRERGLEEGRERGLQEGRHEG